MGDSQLRVPPTTGLFLAASLGQYLKILANPLRARLALFTESIYLGLPPIRPREHFLDQLMEVTAHCRSWRFSTQ